MRSRWIRRLACVAFSFRVAAGGGALAAGGGTLAACGGDEPLEISTGDAGPKEPKPTGAVNMEVYATEMQTCPPGNVHIDIGVVSSDPPVLLADGEDGAKVACAVVPISGGKFDASGSLEKDNFSFAFSGVETNGTSALGTVEVSDPKTGTRYKSASAMPCVFQFAPGPDQGVDAGEIFVQFDCPDLVSETDAKASCSSRYGYVRLHTCATFAATP